ncbi:PEP-CTERM sorting domain-containing protein [Nostoc sp. CENA543]|uniref:PEP-CTERM sorting domain-containing protein n=1 Tax=Nostoc sp. CENA543 TaxID=1869241 RepID=UPI000CA2E399|nr:PEP-CTERM sorting domain-containing protein [Nostoc sp. CENA543]AUT03241.1 PEP-CTERM sorting domain-containing protein [Nostoc sp. CENA543]
MTLGKNLGLATIATAISVAAIASKPAQAAIVNYNFTVNTSAAQYFGSVKYEDSFLTGLGLETLGVENGLKVTFNYLGNNYTEADDVDFANYPVVTFDAGKFQGLTYFVADQFLIASDPSTPEIGGNNFYTISNSVNTTLAGTVTYTKVPEPFAVGGTAIATTLGLWMKRKKKAALAG